MITSFHLLPNMHPPNDANPPVLASPIKILQWNCHSITNKIDLLRSIADDYDIIALSESWLRPELTFSIRDFHIIRKDGLTRNSGGLLLAIKCNIPFKIVNKIVNNFQIPNCLECQAITIPVENQHLLLTSIYRSSHYSLRVEDWNDLFHFCNSHPLSILTGDLKSHHTEWGCDRNDSTGAALLASASAFSFICLNDGTPTLLIRPNQSKSVIDLSFVSPPLYFSCDMNVLSDLIFSDHFPISITINCTIKRRSFFSHKIKLKKPDQDQFVQNLLQNYPLLNSSLSDPQTLFD